MSARGLGVWCQWCVSKEATKRVLILGVQWTLCGLCARRKGGEK